ncbi:hypothetical protein [Tsukamurella soli]|uniref:Uncharacterized protein n=1 Tax=Tsukamurella soli TaxID=644556 RepID=A0ABP8JNU5_9ACTN
MTVLPTNVALALGAGLYMLAAIHGAMFITDTVGSPLLRRRPEADDPDGRRMRTSRRASYRAGLTHLVLTTATVYAAWLTVHRPTLPVLGLVLALGVVSAVEPGIRLAESAAGARRLRMGAVTVAVLLSIIPTQILMTAATGALR